MVGETKMKYPLINSDTEIYSPCRHKSKFYRFLATCNCTDEHDECEKGKCPTDMCAHKEARKKAKKSEREKAKKEGKKTVRVARLRILLSTIDENSCSQFCGFIH